MPIEITDTDPPTPRTLAVGDELSVRLAENPTTGYRWQVVQSGAGELALADEQFVPAAGATPGAGGERRLRFVARRAGDVRLEMVLGRPWDPPETRRERRVHAITVSG